MAISIVRYGVGLRDARGQVGRVSGYMNLGATGTADEANQLIANIITAIQALSNGLPVSYSGWGNVAGNQVLNPDQYGANAEYPNAEDKALLRFLHDDNTFTTMAIPAPKLAIFLTDGETVDPTNASVVALVAALTADGTNGEVASNRHGAVYTALVLGMRQRRRFQRKLSIWTKNPAESGPGE